MLMASMGTRFGAKASTLRPDLPFFGAIWAIPLCRHSLARPFPCKAIPLRGLPLARPLPCEAISLYRGPSAVDRDAKCAGHQDHQELGKWFHRGRLPRFPINLWCSMPVPPRQGKTIFGICVAIPSRRPLGIRECPWVASKMSADCMSLLLHSLPVFHDGARIGRRWRGH